MTSESDSANPDSDRRPGELPTTSFNADDLDATRAQASATEHASEHSTSTAMPTLAGYELLEELGRGGMGVVYRAHHKKLDRAVAIKMILAGQFASAESIQRFALEAETAARLDHPGIVPIYEIGQAGDHHFFSMKLIDGNPLSSMLDEYKPDQRKSVALMIEVAKAVQHAHQRGILHRDLKPANVLIDRDGRPLLTDLGLAKQLDSDSAITQTGLVLGSPGFMSPEQAAGQTDVTIAADVYALGAMLYWLVSGRAPITGKNPFDIVQKTIEHEPESIRELRVDADRDLNLICLKALQKSPTERYHSAEAFASELQAWLDGEPLSVKPPTLFTSMRRWIQTNFRGVAVGVGVGSVCGLLMGFIILLQIAEGQLKAANALHEQLEAANPPWITSYFSWVVRVPEGIRETLPSWITVITAICGIATIGLSKPKRRDSGFAAAITASLLAGILSFVISWAWQPIANRTRQASHQDLQLLSDYLFLHPDDRALAEEIIFQRYPGLPKADTWERSGLMTAKISSDQAISIPGGIWIGLIVAGFVTAMPLFISSVLASVVWQRDYRRWAFLWRSLEIGVYATTLMFLMCRSLSDFLGAPPALRFQLISIVAIMAAIAIALKCKSVWWRIPMFVLVFVTTGMNLADSSKVDGAHWRAKTASTDAELAEIAPYFERHVAMNDDRKRRFQLATIYAYLGDDANYKKHCDLLLVDGNFYRRAVAEQTAKVVLLKPDIHTDLKQAHQLARWASEQRAWNGWDYLCRALSEQRQGNSAEALKWTEKCREAATQQQAWQKDTLIATAHLLDALVYQAQNDDQKMQLSQQEASNTFQPDSESSFEAKLTYKLLLAELRRARN